MMAIPAPTLLQMFQILLETKSLSESEGFDTPEIRGKCDIEKSRAKQVRDFVRDLHSQATTIELKNCERGKYFSLGLLCFS